MNTPQLTTKRSSYAPVKVILGALAVGSLLAPREARAQEWLKDRSYQEGAGIRTGDLEVHPGLGGEVGYDSNYLLRSHKDGPGISNAAPAAPVEGAAMLRITPSLSLATLGTQRKEGDLELTPPAVAFRMGLAATYRALFGAEVIRKQNNVSGAANARIDFAPQRPVGFGVFGTYERTIRPSTVGNPDLSFNRDDITAGGELVLQPGGGTLDWRFGYQFRASLFEDELGTPFTNNTHEAYTRGRWRFRPRTALLYDASLRWLQYTNADRAVTQLNDGSPTRARLGITGLVTPRVGFLGMAGYGATFFNNPNAVYVKQYDSVIGQAEIKFFLSATPGQDPDQSVGLSISSIALGYNRDFQTSFLGNYYGIDRGYLKFVYMFGGKFLLSAEGGFGAISYPEVFTQGQTVPISGAFTDLRADATLFGEYRVSNSVGINTTLRYSEEISDKQLPLGISPGGTAGLYDLNWRRFEAFLGARWFL
jgi:hypothetical protein